MTINENKNLEQSLVLQKWKEAGFKGTYVGFTGVGKTRLGTIAASEFIKRDPNERSLVVVPTENLRDNEWERSFEKWGYSRQRPNVEIVCIQTAYKYTGRHYDTIVIDEWHTTLGPQYRNLLKNNTYKRLLCLTATIDDAEKRSFTQDLAPIIHETSRERAIQLKLVSESMVFNLGVPLTPEEQKLYNYYNDNYNKNADALGGPLAAFEQSKRFMKFSGVKETYPLYVFVPEMRVIYRNEIDDVRIPSNLCRPISAQEYKELMEKVKAAHDYSKFMRERKNFLINLSSKIDMVKQIVERYPERRAIIFSESTSLADAIAAALNQLKEVCGIFHTKVLPASRKRNMLSRFIDGALQYLSSVRALNAGLDVPDCSLGISTSGDSKSLTQVQRNGRISRYIDGKVAYHFNLYALGTQEERWVRNSTRNMDPKWITSLDEAPLV